MTEPSTNISGKMVCTPPIVNNDCLETSPYGGCIEERCANMVCAIIPDCCNNEDFGEWAGICVRVAKEVCQPKMIPK
jgi:hypothetical protein